MSEFSLGEAALATSVDLSGLNKGMDKAEADAKGGFGRIGDILGGALKVGLVGAAAGFVALGTAIAGGVGDAQETVKLMASTQQTITTMGNAAGRSAQQVADMASALSDASGKSLFGDDQIQQSENLLLTFGEIKGATFDAATALTVDLAQALGGAPKDQAMMLGKALNDPIHGMTALGKAGLTFSEEQKAAIKAMQESGDMAGAQNVIIAELNKQVGGQAAAAAAATGGWVQFKAGLGETFETIGASLLPILNDLGAWLNSPEVKAGIQAFADAMVAAFGWLHDNIPPIIDMVVTAVNQGVAIISGLFQGPLADSLNENASFFKTTFDQIVSIVTTVVGIVTTLFGQLTQFLTAHSAQIQLVLSAAWDVIKALITGALAIIEGVVKTALALINGDWAGAWEAIKKMSATVVESIGGVIKGGLNIIAGLFGTTIDDIIDLWANLGRQAASLGGDIIDGIISGVKGAAQSLYHTLTNIAHDALQAAKDALGIGSPSRVFAEGVGKPIIAGMLEGMQSMLPELTAFVASLGDNLAKQMDGIVKNINDTLSGGFGAEASIDRIKAKNLEALAEVGAANKRYAEAQLQTATEIANQFADPKAGAAYLKMRSDQIFELAKLQDKASADLSNADRARVEAEIAARQKMLDDQGKTMTDAAKQQAASEIADLSDLLKGDLTDAERERLQAQIDLISQAQVAEQNAFRIDNPRDTSPLLDIWTQVNDLMKDITNFNLTDEQIHMVDALRGMLGQLSTPTGGAFAAPAMGTIDVGGITIYQQPGQDSQALADQVMRVIEQRLGGRI